MNIKDLIGTKSAVQCETKDDWDKLSQLTGNEEINYFNNSSSAKCFDLMNVGTFWVVLLFRRNRKKWIYNIQSI